VTCGQKSPRPAEGGDRLEHRVPDYEGWKQAFDSDPADRKGSGVKRYRIMRSLDDPLHVLIDLEFDTARDAEGLLGSMRKIWEQLQGKLIFEPRAMIVEVVEDRSL
jgi:hypothetical protein